MIRLANKFDNPAIIKLLKDFALTSGVQIANRPMDWSLQEIETILSSIYAGQGFILIDEENTGILIAVKTPCFWMKNIIQLQEVMLHGTNKVIIARLIKHYLMMARQMISNGEIAKATMASYKDNDYGRYDMKKLETHWEIV